MRDRPGRPTVAVIGAGIVGLATASALLRLSSPPKVVVLDKEPTVAAHQTGHNSGVIHSGIYYRPGSLKARLCIEGHDRTVQFCRERGVAFELCGKTIVASHERELPRLEELRRRGEANGLSGLEYLGPQALRQVEPHVRAVRALKVPSTGIVDYGAVARALEKDLRSQGVRFRLGSALRGVEVRPGGLRLRLQDGEVGAEFLVNCAGLHSDVVARMCGLRPPARIIPFRGEYYVLRAERRELVRGLVYPVPDPELPFLGVHFTRTVHGEVEAGPNAVLALAREGYSWREIHPRELLGSLTYPGLWRALPRLGRTSLEEIDRSFRKSVFVRSLQRMVPLIAASDLVKGGAGVRAQAVGLDGRLVDDFLFATSPRAVHVLNAPSPAATAAFPIGDHVARQVVALQAEGSRPSARATSGD